MNQQFKTIGALLTIMATLIFTSSYATESLDLSASPEVSGTAPDKVKMPKQQNRLQQNYVNQPPLIPHSVDGYQISKNTNRCLQCHGVDHYRTTNAPRVSPTHFLDSNGQVSNDVAGRRYFCLSCHVPQTDAPAIIDNNFQPAPGFGK